METELQSRPSLAHSQEEYFRIQLNSQQLSVLAQLIPIGYSFQVQNKNTKRSSKLSKKIFSEVSLGQVGIASPENVPGQVRIKKSTSSINYSQQGEVGYNYNRLNSLTSQNLDEELKPCLKILNLLKNNKSSWPFKDPVDPIALGIPHYKQIIQEPMDLTTIQKNLKANLYVSAAQFHADINKIIRNSYIFNQQNAEFVKLTEDFQKYYFKLITQPVRAPQQQRSQKVVLQPVRKQIKKKPSRVQKQYNQMQQPSLIEKKQLSQQIRRLNKDDLRGVIEIVYNGKNQIKDQFDIEDLQPNKIRELQRYVKSRLANQNVMKPTEKIEHISTNEVHSNQESSFISDSDN